MIREIREEELTKEAFQFTERIRLLNQKQNVSSLSMMHLHTHLPLKDLDVELSEAISKLKDIQELPIIVLVGVQGNRGYAIDSIPVGFRMNIKM